MHITLKSPEDIERMRVAGRLAAEVLQVVAPHVKPGVTTAELDRICHDHIVNVQGAIPANVGYKGFPATVCTSVNNVICHGIPSEAKVLKDGDILNIDVTVIKDGWHGDTSRMYFVGEPSIKARRLVDVTREAMFRGIRVVKPGATLGDIGHAIQKYAEGEREWAAAMGTEWLGFMVAGTMLQAIVYGLMPDERWHARHNAGLDTRAARPSGWGAVLGVIVALLVGAWGLWSAVAMATASRPFVTCPTTSMSGSSPSIKASPSLTTVWSSTINTDIRFISSGVSRFASEIPCPSAGLHPQARAR